MLSSSSRRLVLIVSSRRGQSVLSRNTVRSYQHRNDHDKTITSTSSSFASTFNETNNERMISLHTGGPRHNPLPSSSAFSSSSIFKLDDHGNNSMNINIMGRCRHFSSSTKKAADDGSDKDTTTKTDHDDAGGKEDSGDDKKKESFEDMLNRMESEGSTTEKKEASSSDSQWDSDSMLRRVSRTFASFTDEVSATWQDLLKSGERKDINKKIHQPEATEEGEAAYTGPVEIMVIDESENLTAWERMQRRLTDAPIIQGKFSPLRVTSSIIYNSIW